MLLLEFPLIKFIREPTSPYPDSIHSSVVLLLTCLLTEISASCPVSQDLSTYSTMPWVLTNELWFSTCLFRYSLLHSSVQQCDPVLITNKPKLVKAEASKWAFTGSASSELGCRIAYGAREPLKIKSIEFTLHVDEEWMQSFKACNSRPIPHKERTLRKTLQGNEWKGKAKKKTWLQCQTILPPRYSRIDVVPTTSIQ